MRKHPTTHPGVRHGLAELRRAGYAGPPYLRGRPAYEYVSRRHRSVRRSPADVV
jgi:hypothetical protein